MISRAKGRVRSGAVAQDAATQLVREVTRTAHEVQEAQRRHEQAVKNLEDAERIIKQGRTAPPATPHDVRPGPAKPKENKA